MLLAAGHALGAPVTVEGWAEVGDSGDAVARRVAVSRALSGAVEVFVRRHVAPLVRDERGGELDRYFIKRPSQYVLRHASVSELADAAELRLQLTVTVDEKKLLRDLSLRGFGVASLAAPPRLLLVASAGQRSHWALDPLQARLKDEGLGVTVREAPHRLGEAPPDLAGWAREAGAHFAFLFTADPLPYAEIAPQEAEEDADATVAAGGDPATPSDATAEGSDGWLQAVMAPDATEARAPLPPLERLALVGRGWLVSADTGELVGQMAVGHDGAGRTAEEAERDGARQLGELLSQELLGELARSGWTPGEEWTSLEIRVDGLPSPGRLAGVEQALLGVTEIRSLQLVRVESGAAVWRAEAIRSRVDWLTVLGSTAPPGGRISWDGLTDPALSAIPGAGVVHVYGVWLEP